MANSNTTTSSVRLMVWGGPAPEEELSAARKVAAENPGTFGDTLYNVLDRTVIVPHWGRTDIYDLNGRKVRSIPTPTRW